MSSAHTTLSLHLFLVPHIFQRPVLAPLMSPPLMELPLTLPPIHEEKAVQAGRAHILPGTVDG